MSTPRQQSAELLKLWNKVVVDRKQIEADDVVTLAKNTDGWMDRGLSHLVFSRI